MGRRRWRAVTLATILLLMIKGTQCQQEENDFYYTPVERNFAQVQPPLYSNNRPGAFYENGDSYRIGTPQQQQPLYNEGRVRFPSPNYNQNPSPFQLPTGRSQSGTQFYVNQPEYIGVQRQRYRPALPYNYQMVHPASTKRPEVIHSHDIHSLAYQQDPSKPETFLGQITINNPDLDYLQNSRFKNVPFDGNSLKSNGLSGHIPRDEDIDGDHQDIFDHPRVTTYNPNNHLMKQRLNIRPTSIRQPEHDSSISYSDEEDRIRISSEQSKDGENTQKLTQVKKTTENKSLLDLEPFLEDAITDLSFKELMKNTHNSEVQVVQSNKSSNSESAEDSKPDASSMNADNVPKDIPRETATRANNRYASSTPKITTTTSTHSAEHHSEENLGDEEYVEYYDETESSEQQHTTRPPKSTEHVTDIYDEYDTTDETEISTDEVKANTTAFHVLEMKPTKTMVKDDNFKEFVDTTVIDQSEQFEEDVPDHKAAAVESTKMPVTNEDVTSIDTPSILGQEVVSVVTTKSVVNGTISIPDVTFAPRTTKTGVNAQVKSQVKLNNSTSTTENYLVVASVQTSRSVSGARFLPFPAVAQEDKKQLLVDESEEEENVTKDPGLDIKGSSSTENINDKLDSIQSELSSAVLSGSLNNQNKNIELITETTTEQTTREPSTTITTSTSPASLKLFTLKSTQLPSATEKSAPEPPPVMIKKFTHRLSTSTTPRPKKKPSLVTVMEDVAGYLPPGYRPRLSFKDKRTSTTTSTTTTTTVPPSTFTESEVNVTQGRSSGINSKNRVILLDDKSLLPKEYKPKEKPVVEEILKKVPKVDVSQFLPPGYKPPKSDKNADESEEIPDVLGKVQKVDLSSLLPKGYKLNITTEKPQSVAKLAITAKPVDISAFLPPGFKLNGTEVKNIDSPIEIKIADISSLLPSGFKLNKTEDSSKEVTVNIPVTATTKAPGGIKVVFPSRPAGKTNRKTTTPKTSIGPVPVTPKIMKGWPTRASTEFTGWPSPSTTPFSIETFLNKSGTVAASSPDISTVPTTRRATTTTTTTPAPPPSTTPGICQKECDIAATIKIVAGVQWVPELLDYHTKEWQNLAKEVKDELNSVYSKSNLLKKYYKGIRIDGFSKGSVLVDYFVEINDLEDKIDTLTLKKMFHKSLNAAAPGSVVDVVQEEQNEQLDSDVMMGDQPDEERMNKSDEKMTKTIDKSAGKLEMGKFVMDPAYTEFIVLPKRDSPKMQMETEDEASLPQWGIAVIVITLASLLFVVIFGVTVLVNRQKSSKAKQPIPLSEDMLRELDKSHMGGFEEIHQMKERDLPHVPSGKRMSTAFIDQLAYSPGDSWRSEWTPQLSKYMQQQHYTPDSGRGSVYGHAGHGYGYGEGSQLYGHNGGGGSQVYGYTGEYPRPHYGGRRRSDYDDSF